MITFSVSDDQLTNSLLWTLVILGVWNGANILARLFFREPWHLYWWSVFTGAWACLILMLR